MCSASRAILLPPRSNLVNWVKRLADICAKLCARGSNTAIAKKKKSFSKCREALHGHFLLSFSVQRELSITPSLHFVKVMGMLWGYIMCTRNSKFLI